MLQLSQYVLCADSHRYTGMENAVGSGKISTREDRLHRGRKVTSAFLMQGWGQFLNQVILIILLIIFNSGSGNPPYDKLVVQWTYRMSFVIPAIGTLWLIYYRFYKMKSASKQLMAAKKKQSVTGYDLKSLKLTFTIFGTRVFATAFGWVSHIRISSCTCFANADAVRQRRIFLWQQALSIPVYRCPESKCDERHNELALESGQCWCRACWILPCLFLDRQ